MQSQRTLRWRLPITRAASKEILGRCVGNRGLLGGIGGAFYLTSDAFYSQASSTLRGAVPQMNVRQRMVR